MRVLVTTSGSAGHLLPLVPFTDALRDRGAEILVATRASTADAVRAHGFDVWPFGEAPSAERDPIFASAQGRSNDEANILVVTEAFARLDARAALPGVLDACRTWRPDLVINEVTEFAGPLAATHEGIPYATVGISLAALERKVMPHVGAVLDELRAELGTPPGAHVPSRMLSLAPPALDDPAPEQLLRFRHRDAGAPRPLPDFWDGADGPLVYVTFGSVAPQMGFFPDLYRAAVDALAGLPVRVLVTTGRAGDPAALGALPANAHAERWVPQADLLPHVAALVCHGGSGTVHGGLAAGVPMAVLPLFADRPYNAACVAEIGAGVALAQGPAGIAGVADAVRALLEDPAYAGRARAIAAETRRLPTVDAAAEVLHELAHVPATTQAG